jgi:cell filamentation protein
MSTDPYVDPATGVLRNRLGITHPAQLTLAEAEITQLALARIALRTVPGSYDLKHLCAFHREIFGDVYPWAGEIRTVAIAKQDLFCLPQFIEGYADDIARGLASENWLRGLDRSVFVARTVHYFGELNALHPFREGNGRTLRAFLGQLARDAGYAIHWSRLDAERNVRASVQQMRGNSAPALELLRGLIEPS